MLQEIFNACSWWWNANNNTYETLRIILTTIIPFLIFWFIIITLKNKQKLPLPSAPGPYGLPLIGYLPFLGSNLHHSFQELSTKYGPIFKLKLGLQQCIVITSPSLVREVVKDKDVIFANRGNPTIATRSSLFGTTDIGFSDYGPEWRKMRKIFVSQLMSKTSLDASYYLRKQNVNKMMHKTYNNKGKLVDVGELAFLTLISSILNMMWGDTLKGEECSTINIEFRGIISEVTELLGVPNISDLFPWLARFDLQGIEGRVKNASLRSERIYDLVINRCYDNGENNNKKDFLRHLLQLTKSDDPSVSLSLPQVKAILQDTVSAGTDTTATMIEWAMAEMLQQPKILQKAQEEMTQIVGLNNSVEETDLPKLNYLNAIVKETLRLHPSLPLLVPHSPSKPSVIGGYHIPKDTRVFLNVYAIQRDPHFWEDPLVFKPERFLNGSSSDKVDYSGNHFEFIPFGSGRRACVGVSLVERMAVLVLASLVHGFKWKLPNESMDVDFSEKFGIVLKKLKPLIAIPSPRLSNLELYAYAD